MWFCYVSWREVEGDVGILLANKPRKQLSLSPEKKCLPSSTHKICLSQRDHLIVFRHSELLRSSGYMGCPMQRTFSIQTLLSPTFIITAEMYPCSSLQTRLMYLDHPAILFNQLSNFRPLHQDGERELLKSS